MKKIDIKKIIITLLMIVTSAFFLISCEKEGDKIGDEAPILAGEEKGTYYLDVNGDEYTITLNDGEIANIQFGSENKSAKYTLEGEVLTIIPNDGEAISATYKNGEITLGVNGEEKVFLKKIYYTVTFEANGGVTIGNKSVLNGKKVGEVKTVREHYSFVGWYKDSDLTVEFDTENETITGNVVIYAKWQYVPETNVITLDQSSVTTEITTYSVTEGEAFFLAVPEIPAAYEFKGWMLQDGTLLTDENGSSLDVWNPSFGNVSVYAKLEIILTYTEKDDGCYSVTGNAVSADEETVVIPAYHEGGRVTEVYGFADYKKVKKVSIPATVTDIDEAAFINSSLLAEYEVYAVKDETFAYVSENGVIFKADKHTLVKYPVAKQDEEYKIPASVLYIAPYAFADIAPASIYMDSTAAGVLKSVVLPKNLRQIGDYAFRYRKKLEMAAFENGSAAEWTMGAHAFECTGLTSFSFGENLKEIGESAFAGSMYFTPKFTSVEFGANSKLTKIGERAFENVKKIETAVIPASVNTIGSYAFSSSGLKNLTFAEGSLLTEIQANAFYQCGLLSLKIPEGVIKIGAAAFFSCQQISSLELPSTLKTIGASAFKSARKLTALTMPENLESIGESAFEGSALTKINFNAKLSVIGKAAFKSVAVSKLDIPSSVTEIGESAFENCDVLTEIVLHEGLQKIGAKAFYSPKQAKGQPAILDLESINIPASVTSFGSNIFSKYRNNKTIIVDNDKFIDYFVSCEGSAYTECVKVKDGITVTEETFLNMFEAGESDGTRLSYIKKAVEQ